MRIPGLFLAALLVAAGCGAKAGDAPAPKAPAAPVVTGVAQTRDVPLRLRAVGTVEPVATVSIQPLVGGTLVEAAFEEGQEVHQGDLLFRIDSRPFAASLHQAKAALARDEALYTAARRDAERQETLEKKQYVSQGDRDKAVAQADSYRASMQADKAAIEAAELQLSFCTVRSPIDGRTGPLLVKPGNVVQPAPAPSALVVIHQMQPIRVKFPLPEARLPDVRARMAAGGIPVEAAPVGDTGTPAEGTLTFLGNEVDRTTGTVVLKATFPNEDRRLWPGQFARVSATLGIAQGATVVPSPAVQDGQQGSYVYVVKADGTAELRLVKAGASEDGLTVIDSGVAAGERVIVDGQVRVAPGAPVEERTRAAESEKPR